MPEIFQAQCASCSYESDHFLSGYGAILLDEPTAPQNQGIVAGAVLFGSHSESKLPSTSDPHLLVIAHPLEEDIIAEAGHTQTTLMWMGRYVRVRQVICMSCGTLSEVRSLTCPPGFGCLTGLVIALAMGTCYGVWKQSIGAGFVTFWITAAGVPVITSAFGHFCVRIRFSERAKVIDGPSNCPKCGEKRLAGVESRRVFPCPKCREHAMRIKVVGIS
ncbi:MAG TPA: hypothetical protein VM165_24220 [Planctomycetaceae bacterium]|nr:hypothetical protein [Planctomycetaceae bacterium]